jgi:hypothetical protein
MLKQIPIVLLVTLLSLLLTVSVKFILENHQQDEISPLDGIVVTKDGWSLGTKDIILFCSTLIILSKITKNMNMKFFGVEISWTNVEKVEKETKPEVKVDEKKSE